MYFHGGGWTIGDLDTHDVLCRQLCNGAGAVVVAVDYRMGPEHRFPAAVDDCLAATRWVRDAASELGVDPTRLAIRGDSAGGNLAAVVAILARDAGDLPIAYQLLIYPATDMRRRHASHTTNGRGYLLTTETISYYHDHYIADAAHDLDWRASPLLHADLGRLPRALVLTAGFDPLRDEGLEYADRLVAAGNRVQLRLLRTADPRLHHDGQGHRRSELGSGLVRRRGGARSRALTPLSASTTPGFAAALAVWVSCLNAWPVLRPASAVA